MLSVLADDVDDIVDRDSPEHHVVAVGHGRGDQVMVFELHGDLAVVHIHRNGFDRRIHKVSHLTAWITRQQVRQLQAAQVTALAVDHEEQIEDFRKLFAQAKITQNHVQVDVRPDGQNVRIHQAACGIIGIGQDMHQPLAVLPIQAAQHLADDRIGQVIQNIREVVQVQIVNRRDQVLGRGVTDQACAHLVVDLDQHIAVELGVREFPDGQALGDRERFEQIGNLGR